MVTITIKTGFLEELKGLKNEMDKVHERKDKTETKVVLVLAAVIVALIIVFKYKKYGRRI